MTQSLARSFLDAIDVVVLTWNEEANIGRTLAALTEFPQIVLLDSGSTDRTLAIAREFPNVRVETNPFAGHAAQWNHGLTRCGLSREWVLALDADFVLSPALVKELRALEPSEDVAGYRAGFRYSIAGKPLSGSLYPPVTVLLRRRQAHFVQDGHTQRAAVEGVVRDLRERICHDDRKSLGRWLHSQLGYAQLEADLLRSRPWSALKWQDRLRRMVVITPWLVPLYCLTVGRGLFDGWRGLFYAMQRGIAETLLSLKLLEARAASEEPRP